MKTEPLKILFKIDKTSASSSFMAFFGDTYKATKIGGKLIDRHQTGDFGDISDDDKQANMDAIRANSGRVLSSYTFENTPNTVFFVITDFLVDDNSITTVMLASDY